MDQLLEVLTISSDSDEIEDNVLNEMLIQSLSPESVGILCNRCFVILGDSSGGCDRLKRRALKVIIKLHLFRPSALESSCIQYIVDLISKDNGSLQPSEIMDMVENLLTISALESSVAKCISVRITYLVQQCDSCLPVLTRIANVTHTHPTCLPPLGNQVTFILEIINRIASLDIPKNMTDIIPFVRDVTAVASMVERIWMTSPTEIVLPCLSMVYTLIISSSVDKPPCRTMAAFLQITPVNEIDVALDQLLIQNRQSNDTHVKILASVLCDWLIDWPKAAKLSNWILSLFKMLTLKGKSYIVADVILQKAPQLMERSWLPVMRIVTYPVLRYMLLTFRHSEEVLHLMTGPAVNVFSKLQPHDTTAKIFRSELGEIFHLLIDQFPNSQSHCRSLLPLISDIPKPNEQRVGQLVASVPVLFASAEKGTSESDCPSSIVWNDQRWLQYRSASGKVGLINLGNTCYINCILQSLCMNQDFTCALLEAIPTSHQVFLVKLQTVMAFLLYSFRSAYSPAAFIKISRPPWFEAGRQQDCSEFLRYLLDSLYEQEKADRDLLQCDERWTVYGSPVTGQDLVENDEEGSENANTSGAEVQQCNELSQASSGLQRWITEEDLTTPQHLTAEDEDDLLSEGKTVPLTDEGSPVIAEAEKMKVDSSLSNIHSESTDSGIQSVGDGPSCNQSETEPVEREASKPRSLVHRIFGGKMSTSYLCLECRTESVHQNFFTDLHLAFPEESEIDRSTASKGTKSTRNLEADDGEFALEYLLDYHFSAEKLEGDNRYHCDKCAALRDAERTIRITEAPSHLLLTLLRFRYDRLLQRRGKITTRINYPQQLKLNVDGKQTETYVLYAVVIHSGLSLDGGHYYTFARNSQAMNADPWLMFNDSQVSATDFQTLVSLSKKYPTDTPYLLWYRRLVGDIHVDSASSLRPPLRSDLKEQVDRDNLKFMQEREQDVWRQRNVNTDHRKDRDDDDRDDHYHHDNDQVPRFVF